MQEFLLLYMLWECYSDAARVRESGLGQSGVMKMYY
jgi:hypothetical protein